MDRFDLDNEPTTEAYFELAREINEAARLTIRLGTRDATAIQAKVSIGLSLQAAELAGKGILRMFGESKEQIRRKHGNHNILGLLEDVDMRVRSHDNKALRLHGGFMRWEPIIEKTEFGSTIGQYLQDHFSQGPASQPRNYFYPDLPTFTGPHPIQALYVMVEHIIECGEALLRAQTKNIA